jgi:hypothetical protein
MVVVRLQEQKVPSYRDLNIQGTENASLSRESKVLGRVFRDDPPADILFGMAPLDVLAERLAGVEVVATEVTAVVVLRRHTVGTTRTTIIRRG